MARRSGSGRSTGGWLRFFAFVSIMLLGLALAISFIFNRLGVAESISTWITRIALGIAILIPAFLSYYEARNKSTVWFVLWIIAVVLVAVFYILPWFF